jgi:rhamnosyltransferase
MPEHHEKSVCAVVVTYRPDCARLEQLLSVLTRSVGAVVVADNGSPSLDDRYLVKRFPSLIFKKLDVNEGIAVAQNVGIVLAKSLGASHVLFLDQDSVPEEGMVSRLYAALQKLENGGCRAACVGPRVRFPGSRDLSRFVRLGWFGGRQDRCRDAAGTVECDVLISSGTLVPLRVLDDVGVMEERLFIDQVDTEWCLRARSKGYRIFGVCGAVLEHSLGEHAYRVWIGRWRRLPRHKPFRYYYIFRNTVLLFRRSYVPPKWTLYHLRWLLALFLAYGIFARPRSGELGMMLRGIAHGVRGITGKFEPR